MDCVNLRHQTCEDSDDVGLQVDATLDVKIRNNRLMFALNRRVYFIDLKTGQCEVSDHIPMKSLIDSGNTIKIPFVGGA